MDDDSFNRGGKIPTFDGQFQKFPTWWKKLSAYATMARIKSILKEESDLQLPEKEGCEIDETDEKGKLACLAVNRNEFSGNFFHCIPNIKGNEYHSHRCNSSLNSTLRVVK
jgi:hypothetical protein